LRALPAGGRRGSFSSNACRKDQETVIKIIDAMIAKQPMESALLPVDEPEG
jgi:hypothetical protein